MLFELIALRILMVCYGRPKVFWSSSLLVYLNSFLGSFSDNLSLKELINKGCLKLGFLVTFLCSSCDPHPSEFNGLLWINIKLETCWYFFSLFILNSCPLFFCNIFSLAHVILTLQNFNGLLRTTKTFPVPLPPSGFSTNLSDSWLVKGN